ncbi:MAG: 50S ribosomal protein L17 [Candidatus Omnitrophota bacterium]|nr:50S ribosomal protein L17 [Candidatus Omnitrophota bacterium]
MRHRKRKLDLNRWTSWRKATLKSMLVSLFTYQSIKTTLLRAKAARILAEKLISLAKENTLMARRQADSLLGDKKLVSLLFNEIGPRFINRAGGYTRIIKLGLRRGDNAMMAILELTEIKKKEPKKSVQKKEEELKEKKKSEAAEENIVEEKKSRENIALKEKPPIVKKPTKKFFGGLRNIFKKERDSL